MRDVLPPSARRRLALFDRAVTLIAVALVLAVAQYHLILWIGGWQ